jgi:predicted acylesterase/phospholipase RssA
MRPGNARCAGLFDVSRDVGVTAQREHQAREVAATFSPHPCLQTRRRYLSPSRSTPAATDWRLAHQRQQLQQADPELRRQYASGPRTQAASCGLFEVAFVSMQATQDTIARLRLSTCAPDVMIQVPRNACGFFEFWRAEELIALGRERAAQASALIERGEERSIRST